MNRALRGIAVGSFLVGACQHNREPSAGAQQPVSVLHGTVSVTGTGFEQQLILRRSGGASVRLVANSADSAALTRVGGTDVAVRGVLGDGVMRVRSFTVEAVSGKPVIDGRLVADGGQLYLETGGGRVLIGRPPPEMRRLAGARVWIGGPMDRGPYAFGVIKP